MSNNLELSQVAAAQNQKEVTSLVSIPRVSICSP